MRNLKRLVLCLGLAALMSVSALASDCDTITAQWFGADGTDGSVLELETVTVNDDIDAILETYGQQRQEQFTSERDSWSRQSDRAAQITELEQRIHAIITDAAVTTLVTDVEETEGGYVATVFEWTFFDYDDLADGEGGSDTAGFGTEHKMTFLYDEAGLLTLVDDRYVESDVLTGEIPTQSAYDEAEVLGMLPVTNPAYVENYDPIKAILYADKWVSHEDLDGGKDPSKYNPEYKSYHNVGGDCSNYVSQCLYAGGMVRSGSWVPDNYVWINCQGQHFHFWNMGKTVANPESKDIYPGSPLYYAYYTHVTICVGYNSAGTPVVNGHTTDRYRVPWDYSKETVAYTLQLTDYRLEPANFEEDALYVRQDVGMPVYDFYRNETSSGELSLKKGEMLPVCAVFGYEDAQWAAVSQGDQIRYVKLNDSLSLASQGIEIALSKDEVTTNDYLTITVSLAEDVLTGAKVTIGESEELEMELAEGKATLTVDCRDLSAGENEIKVVVQGEACDQWIGLEQITVTEKTTVSGKGWSLDKETGVLRILSDVTEAEWLRFADLIKIADVEPEVKQLPENAFRDCDLTEIRGSQDFLEELAKTLDVAFVYNLFCDVSPADWYYGDVVSAAKIGAFQGTSPREFSGTTTMTRSMFVTVLARISGEDVSGYEEVPFTDVEEDTWYSGGLKWAYATGIVKGTSDTTFSPDVQVTREQALTMIGRFISYYGVALEDAETPAAPFVDGDEISDWAEKDVETMRLKGIAQGTPDGAFEPERDVTRAEAATFVMRLFRAIDEQELIPPTTESSPEVEE